MNNQIESLYLHFPFCKHLCNYCDFFKKVPRDAALELNSFHIYMDQAMERHQLLMNEYKLKWAPLKTLYIGGGTPSLWGEKGSEYLSHLLKKYSVTLSSNCEFTLEVNPASWTNESISSWESIGVNRFSLGIQSLNSQSIKYLDRIHNKKDVLDTLKFFQTKRVNYSMDFMLGLPFSKESKRDVIEELKEALDYNPSHFSVYILTVKPNYPHYENLPSEEWIEEEFVKVSNFLKKSGFNHYEVSNFAKDKFESQHNLNYWRSKSVAALGPSATGFFESSRVRYKWKTKEADLEIEQLSEESFYLEKIYMSLRSNEGLDLKLIKEIDLFKTLLGKWKSLGYIEESTSEKVVLSSKGYLLLDSLMSDLFSLKLV